MAFLLYVTIVSTVYIATFKKDFKDEDIGKVSIFLGALIGVVLLLAILSS